MFTKPDLHPTLARFVGQAPQNVPPDAEQGAGSVAPQTAALGRRPAGLPGGAPHAEPGASRRQQPPPGRSEEPRTQAPQGTVETDWVPKLELPKGGGAIRGIGETFDANAFTGSGSLTLPIAVPPSRGISPELSLMYASGAGNGPFGLGWSLGVPAITRKTERELPRYSDAIESDTFVLAGAEDLVPLREDGERVVRDRDNHDVYPYRPRVEGAFARIERWVRRSDGDTHWRVIDQNNVTSWFGRTDEARIADPSHPSNVFEWRLEETSDDRGNIVQYRYRPEDARVTGTGLVAENNRAPSAGRYLERILYGNREPDVADDWMFEIVFDYGGHGEIDVQTGEVVVTPDEDRDWVLRPDAFSSFRAGFDIRTRRRCERVLAFHRFAELGADPVLVRSTDFEYDDAEHLAKLVRVVARWYEPGTLPNGYVAAEMPAVELVYSSAEFRPEIRELDRENANIPQGVDGSGFRFADLDGEGLPGIATEIDGTLHYKRPLGEGRFGVLQPLREQAVTAKLGRGAELRDVDGDGRLELATTEGFYMRRASGDGLVGFVSYETLPNIDFGDPNLQRIDLNGDGHPDLLIARAEGFHWYPSKGAAGYGNPRFVPSPPNERAGPALVFADGTGTIFWADMTGAGLTDLVRVQHGAVYYWPNLGHGRFGRRVTMGGNVQLASGDEFNPAFVRLGDLDGSGTADLVYLDSRGARVWLNLSGNAFSEPIRLHAFPGVDSAAAVEVIDLYGKATACLVWSTAADWASPHKVWVLDLLPEKPHMLVSVRNDLGLETRLAWEPSTKQYLRDRMAGRPWVTRLPFPVQVVTRVEQYDAVTRRRFVQQYAYHHGFFDGIEREFRGFGMVERWDTETFEDFNHDGMFSLDLFDAVEENLHQPPVYTKSWFHTGAFFGRAKASRMMADEYWQGDETAWTLPDTVLPAGMRPAESREAARALRGRMLREEVYALDGTEGEGEPYSVTEQNATVHRLQPQSLLKKHGENVVEPGVFFVHDRERLAMHHERDPGNPRVEHTLVLRVDDYGNVIRAATVAYPARVAEMGVPEQEEGAVVVSEASFCALDDPQSEPDVYRASVPAEERTYELHIDVDTETPLNVSDLGDVINAAARTDPEATPSAGNLRLLNATRSFYYADDLIGVLPLGECGARALPDETHTAAFSEGQREAVWGADVSGTLLEEDGGYVQDDDIWWSRSGRQVFDQDRFYLPVTGVDPFGNETDITYDEHHLFIVELEDDVGNVIRAEHDYRVLAPRLLTDPNGNRTAVAFDTRGVVIAMARMAREGANEGDTLEEPTSRFSYDPFAWRDQEGDQASPVWVRTASRETHSDPQTRWLERVAYFDAMGNTLLDKVSAEPGLAPERDDNGELVFDDGELLWTHAEPRWVGTGRTFLDNKGNPVKQYEPYFSSTDAYEDEVEVREQGVTAILHYDPLGRLIRTDFADGTFSRVEFTPWRETAWDRNDTAGDSDWFAERIALPSSDPERQAAQSTEPHHNTPTVTHHEPQGHPVRVIADLGGQTFLETRSILDVEGNVLAVIDARQNIAEENMFGMAGQALLTTSVDAGERRSVADVLGAPLRMFDGMGRTHRFRYDALRRPTHHFVQSAAGDEALVALSVWGELADDPEDANLRGRLLRQYDGAGLLVNARYDFAGNLVEQTRQLAASYDAVPDWRDLADEPTLEGLDAAAANLLEPEIFTTETTYDALDRPLTRTTHDGSVTRYAYNEGGLLVSVEADVRGVSTGTPFVENIDYDVHGRRARLQLGNATTTTYTYDPVTFRLQRLVTTRGGDALQDLQYTYDPVGNIVELHDDATQTVYFGNTAIEPHQSFRYDALYRLIEAHGREHVSQNQPDHNEPSLGPQPAPSDPEALRNYTERYTYDEVGNITEMQHLANGNGWTRTYTYAPDGNRLLENSAPGSGTHDYSYDAQGNMTAMNHLSTIDWDHADRMQHAAREGNGSGGVYFQYDAEGNRVRKVWVNRNGTAANERIYLGGLELYHERRVTNGELSNIDRERETLHIADDTGRIVIVETLIIDDSGEVLSPTSLARYQYGNHLGTVSLDLDADANVISYEEYHPYGTSAYRAVDSAIEVSPKRYRYVAVERDEETGLDHMGARYYAPWLGRWTSADPIGLSDGVNRYTYVRGNPVSMRDPGGTRTEHPRAYKGPTSVQPMRDPGGTRTEHPRAYKGPTSVQFDSPSSGTIGHSVVVDIPQPQEVKQETGEQPKKLVKGSVGSETEFGVNTKVSLWGEVAIERLKIRMGVSWSLDEEHQEERPAEFKEFKSEASVPLQFKAPLGKGTWNFGAGVTGKGRFSVTPEGPSLGAGGAADFGFTLNFRRRWLEIEASLGVFGGSMTTLRGTDFSAGGKLRLELQVAKVIAFFGEAMAKGESKQEDSWKGGSSVEGVLGVRILFGQGGWRNWRSRSRQNR